LALLVIAMLPKTAAAVDVNQIEADLATKGVTGWIHGAVKDRNLYVFTFRNPENFFDYLEMSLVAPDPAFGKSLETLTRHDLVRIKGTFMDNRSPQKHISLTSLELLQKFQNPYATEPYKYEAKIPDDLVNLSTATFLVHAIVGDGQILVVEYKDQVLPIYVHNAELTKNLARNDIVELKFHIQKKPNEPTHLGINEKETNPVQVIESVTAMHGKPVSFEGALVMFPKSPEIMFNVFAVEDQSHPGLKRQFTLVNVDDPKVFAAIRAALQAAWDRHPGQYVNGRSKLVSQKIRVRAQGTFNEVQANQANAQILLKSADAIQIIEN